jgi:hypothetical protein
MMHVYQEKAHPENRIVFQCRADRHEQMIALRRRAEKLGLTPGDFVEVNRPSAKVGRGT